MSGGPYMTWMTCQPKADLTGFSKAPGLASGAKMASLNAWSTWLSLSK